MSDSCNNRKNKIVKIIAATIINNNNDDDYDNSCCNYNYNYNYSRWWNNKYDNYNCTMMRKHLYYFLLFYINQIVQQLI